MPDTDIDVSYVCPTYNKSDFLRYFLGSLWAQEGDFSAEYIFVDDASTDRTREVLLRETADWPNVSIIENDDNAGPSIRINQGVARARGRYLSLVDPDEVLAANAVISMMNLLERHGADVVHGKWFMTGKPVADIEARAIGAAPRHLVSDHPLDTVLGRGFIRMTWFVRRALFERAGGCDERVFVQDESLRLRLCLHAQRFIDLREVVSYVPIGGEHLSEDTAQLHHDRFLVYYLFLTETPELTDGQRRILYRQCVSSAWKSARQCPDLPAKLRFLARYLASRLGNDRPNEAALSDIARHFASLPWVRKPGPTTFAN